MIDAIKWCWRAIWTIITYAVIGVIWLYWALMGVALLFVCWKILAFLGGRILLLGGWVKEYPGLCIGTAVEIAAAIAIFIYGRRLWREWQWRKWDREYYGIEPEPYTNGIINRKQLIAMWCGICSASVVLLVPPSGRYENQDWPGFIFTQNMTHYRDRVQVPLGIIGLFTAGTMISFAEPKVR